MSSGRIIKDDIDKFFEYGLYTNTRTLYIGSNDGTNEDDVDAALAEKAIKGLHILDLPRSANKPITIILNSPGGDETAGLAIYDAIRSCNSYVVVKVIGQACSMGSIILQAGDERIMMPNAICMIHYGTTFYSAESHTKIGYKWMDESKRFDKWMEQLYLEKIREKHPKYLLQKVKDMLEYDTILPAVKAVELGLADKVEEYE